MADSIWLSSSDYVLPVPSIPQNLLSEELAGLYGQTLLQELGEIINLYEVYDKGAKFIAEATEDYAPAQLRFKHAANLINKETRFLFSKPPDFFTDVIPATQSTESVKVAKDQTSVIQDYVAKVFKTTKFNSKLIKACKDCFIGKRVAYFVNFNEDTERITITFIPSLGFIYETDQDDPDIITKIVCFYTIDDNVKNKKDQRIYKKKYWMQNGFCWIYEAIFDGLGVKIEDITKDRATKFTYIPAGVIINDGLTGDTKGRSDIQSIKDYESWYSKLSCADIDSERMSMNPIRWTRDMDSNSTKNLSIAAGAYWDLQTDQVSADDGLTGETGVLETAMNYSTPLGATLDRIKNAMHEDLDTPNVSPDALKGIVSSGKTLKAIYWGLIVRCDEKMLEWRPALENIAKILIDGAKLYPKATKPYTLQPIPDVPVDIRVENQYSLPEDEQEEKQVDLAEVESKTMSRKTYMVKWRGLTEDEAQQELDQIAMEQQLLENSFAMPNEEDLENTNSL